MISRAHISPSKDGLTTRCCISGLTMFEHHPYQFNFDEGTGSTIEYRVLMDVNYHRCHAIKEDDDDQGR